MTKTYEALNRAANGRRPVHTIVDGVSRPVPDIDWDLAPLQEVQYQRVRVWLTGAASRGQAIKTVMIASCHSGTGTTTTAALLATTLSEGGTLRVLIVDGNFRTPALGQVFNVRSGNGLSDMVEEGLPVDNGLRTTGRTNLSVIPTGHISRCPAVVFEGSAIDRFIDDMKHRFDFIIFDGAPVLEFPDAYALAPKVDGVILVVEAEKTTVEDAQRAKRALEESGGRVLGVILNRQRDYTPSIVKRLLRLAS